MKNGLTFLAILVVAVAAAWYSLSPQFPVALGLDLRGGMRVALEADPTKLEPGQKVDQETMSSVRNVLENRVNSFGLSGTEVRLKGQDQVLVLLPGASRPEEALKTMVTVAQLEFRHLNNVQTTRNPGARFKMDIAPGDPKKGEPDTYTFTDTAEGGKSVDQKEVLKDAPLILRGDALKPSSRPQINPSSGEPLVTFELKPEGARAFGDFTIDGRDEILAIVLDNKVISAPRIEEPITGGQGVIRGGFKTMSEARVLANLLNSGALPIAMRPAEVQTVGATLGQESIDRSLLAGGIGLAFVLVFMVGYYWLPGVLACLALLFYSVLTFALFKGVGIFPPIVLDLPGITGFILSVGMAVDANVLIFERLKEELRSGKNLHSAIDAGFSRAFSSILDSNVTTWIVCGILVWLGAPIIRGFAITLALGVAVSMFTAITVTRTMLHLVVSMDWARREGMYGLNVGWLALFFPASRQGGILQVYDKRRIYFGFSIGISVLALVFIAMTPFGKGLQTGIDFNGGQAIEIAFRGKDVTREQVLQAVQGAGVQDPVISIGKDERSWSRVAIEATDVDQVSVDALKTRLKNLRGFDLSSYTSAQDPAKKFKATALFVVPTTQAAIETALNLPGTDADTKPTLKSLRVTVADEPHQGAAAILVAEIRTKGGSTEQASKIRQALAQVGGGSIDAMYQENFIGPTVAKEITQNAFWSVLVASLAIILYLAFRFAIGGFLNGLKFGVCAVIALIHDVGMTIGLFALMGGIAGWEIDSLFVTACLTVLGFSVHDTIVVYDRIRENLRHRRRNETLAQVSDRSITQTFDRSINTSMTVLLVVAALVLFGGDSIRLFNIALLFGIAIGTYSSIFVASPLVVLLEQKLIAGEQAATTQPGRRRDDVQLQPSRQRAATPAAAVAGAGTVSTASSGDGVSDVGATSPRQVGATATVRPKRKRRQ